MHLRKILKKLKKIKLDLGKKRFRKRKKMLNRSWIKIDGKEYSIKKLSTENKELYGSVKPTEISKIILENEKLDIKPSMIQLTKEIKSLGKLQSKKLFFSF